MLLGTRRPVIDNRSNIAPTSVDGLAADLSTFPDDPLLRDLYDQATSGLTGERGTRAPDHKSGHLPTVPYR